MSDTDRSTDSAAHAGSPQPMTGADTTPASTGFEPAAPLKGATVGAGAAAEAGTDTAGTQTANGDKGEPVDLKQTLKDKAGEFRVRFKYNSEVMFSTEGYASKASAKNAIDSIKKNGPEAPIDDTTD